MLYFREADINANSIGTSDVANPTKLEIDSLIRVIILEKFAIINVTIIMYST